jgi:hypothetical protein
VQHLCSVGLIQHATGMLALREDAPVLADPAYSGNSAEIPHSRMREQERERDRLKSAEFPHAGAEFPHNFRVTCLVRVNDDK